MKSNIDMNIICGLKNRLPFSVIVAIFKNDNPGILHSKVYKLNLRDISPFLKSSLAVQV